MPRANRFDQLIDAWEPVLKRAFLDSISNLRDAAQIDQIVRMLENNDVGGALRAVGIDPVAFRPFDKSITAAFEAGGEATAAIVPVTRDAAGFRSVFQFAIRNPEAENWLRSYSGGLISDIVDDQRTAVRNFLSARLQEGANPRTTALDLVGRIAKETGRREGGVIGLTSSQEEWVRNYSAELASDNPKAALSRNLRDKRFDRAVVRAANEGRALTAAEIEPMTRAYRNRALRYRAETIARKETITALHTAQEMALDQATAAGGVDAENIMMVWHSAHDDRVRAAHRDLDGKRVKRGGYFQSSLGPIRYPGDPSASAANTVNCRCWLEPRIDFLAGIR